jgi:hypothetical protein
MKNQAVNYRSVLEDLKARRDRLTHAIEAIEGIIGGSEPSDSPGEMVSHDVYREMTIGDACVDFIRRKRAVQSTKALVAGIVAGGITSKSQNMYTTTYNTMTARAKRENSDVVKESKGWGLTEWKQDE